jgi:hypothetical protein
MEGIAESGLVFIIFISLYILTFIIETFCKDTKNILNRITKHGHKITNRFGFVLTYSYLRG